MSKKEPVEKPQTAQESGIMLGFPPPPARRPSLKDWDMPPFNRWAFQNVRRMMPTVEVYRGDGPVRPLPEQLVDLSEVAFHALDGEVTTVAQMLEASFTDGFIVLWNGQVVCEHYANGMQPHSQHLSQSVSKSLTGALAGIIIDKGLWDPDRPVVDYIPELGACGYADATGRHVLNMTSGVRFDEDYGAPNSDITRVDVSSGWRPATRKHKRETLYDIILSLPKVRAHGEVFEYRSIETDVVAWLLERTTHKPLAELLSEEIWQKIGPERDAYFTVDFAGTALAEGGFNATLRDYARFGQMMADGGRVGDEQVVPADWVAACGTGESELFGEPYTGVSPHGAYSNQWWVHDVNRGDYMARGVFGQMIYIDPASKLVAVKLSSWPDYLVPHFTIDSLRAIIAIRRHLTGEVPASDPPSNGPTLGMPVISA